VAGVDVLDKSALDRLSGIGVYESAFSWEAYVPCHWGAPALLLDVSGVRDHALRAELADYLAYKSRGILRRLLQEFNSMVTFSRAQGPSIVLSESQVAKVRLYARLNRSIVTFLTSDLDKTGGTSDLDKASGLSTDRRQISAYYEMDW